MPDVLVVDDDAPTRELLRLFLEPQGHRVDEAGTAEEAAVRESAPAVAVCDVHMPGANGLWLADRIRDLSPSTAMVLATGDDKVPPTDSLRPGIVAYLVKPIERNALVAAVDEGMRWCAQARARAKQGPAGRLQPGESRLLGGPGQD